MGGTKKSAEPGNEESSVTPAGLLQLMLSDVGAQELIAQMVQSALDDRRNDERDAMIAIVLTNEGFKSALPDILISSDLFKSVLETEVAGELQKQRGGAETNPQAVADILANEDFVAGVGNLLTARIQSEDFPATIKPAIDAHLDAQLPALVAAALPEPPEPPELIAQRAAEAKRDAQERADRRHARELAEEAERVATERAARRKEAQDQRGALMTATAGQPEPVDLATVRGGALLLDDGTHLSIDFTMPVPIDALQAVDSDGLLLRVPAIDVGDGMPEPFTLSAVVLVLEGEEGHRVLRCPMQSPVVVGGGSRARLSENSLLFRPF